MSGHSHSSNIKYRKSRQDFSKSKALQKVRKEIEKLIRLESEISKKSLIIARKNKFSKSKLYQILENIKKEKNKI